MYLNGEHNELVEMALRMVAMRYLGKPHAPDKVECKTMTLETKHYTDGSSATGEAPLPDHSPEQQARARLVASILTEHGQPVSSPEDGDLDDVELERWNVCLEIVRRLDAMAAASGT